MISAIALVFQGVYPTNRAAYKFTKPINNNFTNIAVHIKNNFLPLNTKGYILAR